MEDPNPNPSAYAKVSAQIHVSLKHLVPREVEALLPWNDVLLEAVRDLAANGWERKAQRLPQGEKSDAFHVDKD